MLPNLKIIKPEDMEELKEKREWSKDRNEVARKSIIKEIEKWDNIRDNFKFQFFFSLIVNAYYTKELAEAINKGYEDNTDTAFQFYKDNNLLRK